MIEMKLRIRKTTNLRHFLQSEERQTQKNKLKNNRQVPHQLYNPNIAVRYFQKYIINFAANKMKMKNYQCTNEKV